MKKIIFIVMMGVLLVSYQNVFAAAGSWSSWTYDSVSASSGIKTMSVTMTGGTGAESGTVPNLSFDATALAYIKGWYLYAVETNPGSTGPTDQYDVVINDVHGLDIMGGALANRSNTNTENVFPKFPQTGTGFPALDGTALTVVVSGNAVASSTVVYKLFLVK